MTNARRTTKSARGWLSCGAATAATQNVVRVWRLSAVTLVFGLLAAAPVRAVCINDGQGPDDQPGQKDLSGLRAGPGVFLFRDYALSPVAIRRRELDRE